MAEAILITGGAGFIGSYVADDLLNRGHRVRVLDVLDPQVHGAARRPPAYLASDAELVVGDVRDADIVARCLQGIDVVIHLAAVVGVGQSMYQIERYCSVNCCGTAVLWEEVVKAKIRRVVVASSMSIYGEGLYMNSHGGRVPGVPRRGEDLSAGRWECLDAESGEPLLPLPTPEDKQPHLTSIYAQSKFDQERMSLICADAYRIPTTALRFFNVYGPRQALSNPYTGVLAIFGSRLLNGNRPVVFEDGRQRRDFVHVRDIARACRLTVESAGSENSVLNIGSGEALTISEIAETLAQVLERPELAPQITGRHRVGDIRHCYADTAAAEKEIGYRPSIPLREGVQELAEWLTEQEAVDNVELACAELSRRGLTR